MKLTIIKTFAAAHRLYHYHGDCHNVHGHTYKVELSVKCPDPTDRDNPRNMDIDFSQLKDWLNNHICKLDHACLLNVNDPLLSIFSDHSLRHVPYGGDPTVEAIVFKLHSDLVRELPHWSFKNDVYHVRVKVWESENSCAQYPE